MKTKNELTLNEKKNQKELLGKFKIKFNPENRFLKYEVYMTEISCLGSYDYIRAYLTLYGAKRSIKKMAKRNNKKFVKYINVYNNANEIILEESKKENK